MLRLIPAGLLALALGCGGGGPATGTVNGEVTLDGQPLKSGKVRFVSTDGQTAPADATVTDGKFTAAVPVGAKKVEVSAAKVVGKKKMYDTPDSPVYEETVELIPERYNVKTELTFTVAGGTQPAKFEVKSK